LNTESQAFVIQAITSQVGKRRNRHHFLVVPDDRDFASTRYSEFRATACRADCTTSMRRRRLCAIAMTRPAP
jgi:hypothetical protein